MEKQYTPEQAAEQLTKQLQMNISPRRLRDWLRAGTINGSKFAGQWRLSEVDLQNFISKRKEDNVEQVPNDKSEDLEYCEVLEDSFEDKDRKLQKTLDVRFPYGYGDNEMVWDKGHTMSVEASSPVARILFYQTKLEEEILKFIKLGEDKESSNENKNEILRTYENMTLLESGKIRWRGINFRANIEAIKKSKDSGDITNEEADELFKRQQKLFIEGVQVAKDTWKKHYSIIEIAGES